MGWDGMDGMDGMVLGFFGMLEELSSGIARFLPLVTFLSFFFFREEERAGFSYSSKDKQHCARRESDAGEKKRRHGL